MEIKWIANFAINPETEVIAESFLDGFGFDKGISKILHFLELSILNIEELYLENFCLNVPQVEVLLFSVQPSQN